MIGFFVHCKTSSLYQLIFKKMNEICVNHTQIKSYKAHCQQPRASFKVMNKRYTLLTKLHITSKQDLVFLVPRCLVFRFCLRSLMLYSTKKCPHIESHQKCLINLIKVINQFVQQKKTVSFVSLCSYFVSLIH